MFFFESFILGSISGKQLLKSDFGFEGSKTQFANVKCALSEEEIQEKVETRTSARRNRDFRLADTIKAELMSSGVELLDEDNEWRSFDGKLSGILFVITHLFAL